MFIRSFLFICLAFTFPTATVSAQTITQTQPLSFGTIAIRNYTDAVRLNIRNNGSFSAQNGNAYVIEAPTRGEFLITEAPPNSTYTVTISPSSVTLTGPGGSFELDNFRVRPNTLRTNGAGRDRFRITARLNSLSGTVFGDGTYTGDFDAIINF